MTQKQACNDAGRRGALGFDDVRVESGDPTLTIRERGTASGFYTQHVGNLSLLGLESQGGSSFLKGVRPVGSYFQPDFFPQEPSRKLKESDIIEIKKRLQKKEFQHRIAADYDVNPGRISEINTGKTWQHINPEG